ncbi:hypothetical protein DCAR_0729308 [Daucus carota subsp. sativus]|uniref:Uncharacterized protein n=1 Tax=Daucus carota subsp. sativus TaxID=79200 RepID=A0A164U4M0_DAUCS|nr:hypothetical protein DCAR_0729308 [Daucus carota subsp. sativus]
MRGRLRIIRERNEDKSGIKAKKIEGRDTQDSLIPDYEDGSMYFSVEVLFGGEFNTVYTEYLERAEENEGGNDLDSVLPKSVKFNKCSYCKEDGHNARSCKAKMKEGLQQKDVVEKQQETCQTTPKRVKSSAEITKNSSSLK